MRTLSDIELRSGDRPLVLCPEVGRNAGSPEESRSLAAIVRETLQPFAGWLFFAVAIGLMLHGPRFI